MSSAERLHFRRWTVDDSVSLSVYTPTACGVYVLEFANGEEYVGQTRNLLARIASHRRRWPGEIIAVEFAKVAPLDLDAAERDTIAIRVADGARLRNVDLVALPLRSPELDRVVDPVEVEAWLDGDTDASTIGDRGAQAAQRIRTRPRFEELAAHPQYEDIKSGLGLYLSHVLPYPHRTEGRAWVVTSLPSTGRSKGFRRLAALTINNVEALVIMEGPTLDGTRAACGYLNVALFEDEPPAVSDYVDFEIGEYATTGAVTRAWFEDMQGLVELLTHEAVANAARHLAVGLLRKGHGMFSKHHDYNLADDVFARIEAATPRPSKTHGR